MHSHANCMSLHSPEKRQPSRSCLESLANALVHLASHTRLWCTDKGCRGLMKPSCASSGASGIHKTTSSDSSMFRNTLPTSNLRGRCVPALAAEFCTGNPSWLCSCCSHARLQSLTALLHSYFSDSTQKVLFGCEILARISPVFT